MGRRLCESCTTFVEPIHCESPLSCCCRERVCCASESNAMPQRRGACDAITRAINKHEVSHIPNAREEGDEIIQWIVADIGSNWKAGMNSSDSPQFLGPALSALNYSGRHSHTISNPGPTRWLGKAAQIAYSSCYYAGYPNEANNNKDMVCTTILLSLSLSLTFSLTLILSCFSLLSL